MSAAADRYAMQPPSPGAEAASQREATGIPQTMLTVLGAVGTGIGVLGWVTFLGGAILWIKAAEADLPATESVAIIPKTVLLTQGAEVGALAVIVAVLAVGVLYVIDQGLRWRGKFRLGAAKEHEEIYAANVASAAEEAASFQRQAAESRQLAEGARQRADQEPDEARKQPLLAAADQYQQVATTDQRRANAAREGFADAERQLAGHRSMARAQSRTERIFRAIMAVVLLLGVPVLFAAITGLSFPWTMAVLGIALIPSAFSFLVLLRERWIWFGVAAFLTVSLALTAATLIRTKEELKVEPAAVLREGAGPVCGFFVAQTPTHVYLGTYARHVALEGGPSGSAAGECTGTEPPDASIEQRSLPPRLMSIPVDQVTDTAIGPPLLLKRPGGRDDAPSRSATMALDLCERRGTNGATASTRRPKQGCTRKQIRGLREVAAPG